MAGKAVVLLGAGASYDAGLPLADGLTKKALEAASAGKRVAADSPLPLALNFVISAMQTHAIRRGITGQLSLPGIEQVVSAVKLLDERDDLEIAPFVNDWDEYLARIGERPALIRDSDLDRFAAAILRFVHPDSRENNAAVKEALKRVVYAPLSKHADIRIFKELHAWLTQQVVLDLAVTDNTRTDYLRPLVLWAEHSDATIATLNYDRCIEIAAERARIIVQNPVADWEATGEIAKHERGKVRLLKLHGSIDWQFAPRDGAFSTDWINSTSFRPAIVYGQREKLRADGPFLQLLEAFRVALAGARDLLVIGYSFSDYHITRLVRGWMDRDRTRRVLVIDPGFASSSVNSQSPAGRFALSYGPNREDIPGTDLDGRVIQRWQRSRLHHAAKGAAEVMEELKGHSIDDLFDAYPVAEHIEGGWG